MELCEKLKQIRKENNLTQQQLADELCLSRTVITKYERGHKVPNLDTLILISNYFKTSLFDEYKNKFKLFLLSIRCCIPYLISLILLFVSSISLVCNIVNVSNQYGYNIYNDELKVEKSEAIHIVKYVYSDSNNYRGKRFTSIKSMCKNRLKSTLFYVDNQFLLNSCDFYLLFISYIEFKESNINNEIKISHKPFIYPLKDYDEALSYYEQAGECSKILNYYIDLIEKVK